MAVSRSPMMLEGAKTIAGEKGTVSERSFVMVRLRGCLLLCWAHPDTYSIFEETKGIS